MPPSAGNAGNGKRDVGASPATSTSASSTSDKLACNCPCDRPCRCTTADPNCQFGDEVVSDLRGLLQVGKLESIIHRLLHRIESQQKRIVDLETTLQERMPSLPTLHRFEQRLDAKLAQLDARIAAVDQRVDSVDAPLTRINANTAKVAHVVDLLDRKVDATTFNSTRAELAQLISSAIEDLDKRKAPRGVFSDLEDSQHHVQAQMAALQTVMTTKVDRTEVPLLAAAHETLARLADFQATAKPRLEMLEQDMRSAEATLAEKEDKSAVVARMQNIHEHLLTKTDVDWVDQHVCAPLRTMQDAVERIAVNEEVCGKLLADQQSTAVSVAEMTSKLHERGQTTSRLNRQLKNTLATVLLKKDLDDFDDRARKQAELHTRLIDERSRAAAEETRVHGAYLADIRRQITSVKTQLADTNKKVGVAMRFVDWFAEMKLMSS